jgi:hypothetical protein
MQNLAFSIVLVKPILLLPEGVRHGGGSSLALFGALEVRQDALRQQVP